MFTLVAYLTGSPVLTSGAAALLFWVLTALVTWGFVDVCATAPSKFEAVGQSLAGWLLGHVFFGPLATLGWFVVRRKVKSARSAPVGWCPGPGQSGPAYPHEQPFIPAHRHPADDDSDGSPPLR